MNAIVTKDFNLHNYPKSWAAIDRMRLEDYLHLPVKDQEEVFHELERFCRVRANDTPPRRTLHGYQFLDAGWEWSVFRKDPETVIKVPAGIFPEVNTPEYLANVAGIYELLGEHYPKTMLAPTIFRRHDGVNVLEQLYINSAEGIIIPYDLADAWLLERLATFFEATASLIRAVQWMPDLWLTGEPGGFLLRSVLMDRHCDHFAIVDFSHYLDPSRMYPALRDWCYKDNLRRVDELLTWSRQRLREISPS